MNSEELKTYFKTQFPQSPEICYLNHAAVSPWPKCTEQAVKDFAHENTLFGATHYPQWMAVETQLRKRLASLIHIDNTDEIALAKSTSEALSIIAYGIDWQPGDEVIISDQEFPSNRIVWESLDRIGVNVKTAKLSTKDPVSSVKSCLSPKTKLISISSVQYASGLAINLNSLSTLCKENNVLLCVDAIQSLGAIPFNQAQIDADFIVADGHKWMMAAEGLALLYVKKSHQNTLKLHQFGWHMIKNKGKYDEQEWQPADDASRFECGSPNMLGIHALNASLGLLLEIGEDVIHEELRHKTDYLIQALSQIPHLEFISPEPPKNLSGIVTFNIEDCNLASLQQKLMAAGVICAFRGGGIRFSPSFYTPTETLDKALSILKRLI
jgi:selenocysteine lyase/cysteine desulfurase